MGRSLLNLAPPAFLLKVLRVLIQALLEKSPCQLLIKPFEVDLSQAYWQVHSLEAGTVLAIFLGVGFDPYYSRIGITKVIWEALVSNQSGRSLKSCKSKVFEKEMARELQVSLNQTQKVRLQAALQQLTDIASQASSSSLSVAVADTIPVNHEEGILKGHGTSEFDGQLVATLCGVVERVNKLVYVQPLRARYKPEIGDTIVGRVIESRCCSDAQSMNLPDGIQRRRTAVDELNMEHLEENDVICAEVRGFQHDGLHLQARSQKYGKLERGQLLKVDPYLVKRRKQHFHHLERFGVDLILGCNGFVWVGEHVEPGSVEDPESMARDAEQNFTPLEVRRHICRIANSVRLLSALGFSLTMEAIVDAADAGASSNTDINDMLCGEFYVQTVEREVQRRASLLRKKRG
ncbi:hypothetical protein HPP92_017959 [Vanilla planifolia]|uniref:Ribosomal RNA-processing protein 4 n=1 Tax=Vanilla planifolia TaxID=51239 RepID=A0A835QB53_VANPL|nr:hypothetical protein HPP92_017959 [Vanilla planifolia]